MTTLYLKIRKNIRWRSLLILNHKTIEDNWKLSDFEIDIDESSLRVSLRNVGKFLVETIQVM